MGNKKKYNKRKIYFVKHKVDGTFNQLYEEELTPDWIIVDVKTVKSSIKDGK